MRLRLTIQRNGLPVVNILWSVPDTNSTSAYTITRLLEDVNLIVPLEAEHWGLEHYVVEVGGFECLHFMPVGQALKEEDHVSIRPLMRAEVRARTLTGRHQISDGGQHLVDGLPFGKPYLRQPNRPAVRIPPRKRQRLEEITDEEAAQLATPHLEKEWTQAVDGQEQSGSATKLRSKEAAKKVHFEQSVVAMDVDEDSDEDEDDEDFAPGQESDELDGSGSEDLDSDSDSDTDMSSASNASASGSGSDSDSDSSSDASSSDSDSDSDSNSDAAPEVRSSKAPVPKTIAAQSPTTSKISPPGEGKRTTQSRNARRSKTNRLKYLKESGKLHGDADLKDLDKYDEDIRLQQQGAMSEQRQAFAQSAGKRKRMEDSEPAEIAGDESAELEKRKQEMMVRFGEEPSSATVEAGEAASSKTADATSAPSQQTEETPETTAENKTPERKRLRPDVSAIGRMLARQTKNLAKKPVKAKEPTPEPEGSTDPDYWKSRINLSAFECWEEEYELTAPPFPFQQHWDPVSKVMRDAVKKKGKKGGKKPAPVEELEEEEEEEEKIFLNYDDTPNDDNPDVEIHAAIEDQLQQDIATASQEQSDLPLLPADLSTLPDLTSADIKAGAVVVCRFFGVNPVTVTPEISDFKTAIVDREGDSGAGAGTIRLRIAERDLPRKEKKFDSKGNRIYDARDGFFMDEEEDEGLWGGMFGELLEGKLLKAA